MNPPAQDNTHIADGMCRNCYYEVPPDQMERFGKLTPHQRLKWLDEARRFTLLGHASLSRVQEGGEKARSE